MTRQTKKETAIQLYKRVKQGPAGVIPSESPSSFGPMTRERYELWFNTWIAPNLKKLIPLLKNVKLDD